MKDYLQLAEAFSRWENGEVPLFNGDISGWNGDSSGWDGDSVTNMSGMFAGVTDLSRRENDMSEQALNESIAHWERLKDAAERGDVEGIKAEGFHGDSCPLCQLFAVTEAYCEGCPVSEATGRMWCDGTPYRRAHIALSFVQDAPRSAATAVNDELEFLRSLRRTNNG